MNRAHHFDAVTLCPIGGGLISGGPLFQRAELVCHCLLVESSSGLVLIDTGLFASDEATARRIDSAARVSLRPRGGVTSTAKRAIERLGFAASDVRHVIPTHLDLDHAGGLPDFPNATVHVHAPELDAAVARQTMIEKARYVPSQWAHDVTWRRYEAGGDTWKGFEAVRPLEGDDDVAIIPLAGHTRGHVGVAVRASGGWVLHAGDAYFSAREVTDGRLAPTAIELYQVMMATDDEARRANRERLRALVRTASDVRVFCAHAREELTAYGAQPRG